MVLLLALLLGCGGDKALDDSGASEGEGEGDDSGVDDDRYFPDGAVWYEDVSDDTPDPSSEDVIAALQEHGWGLGRFQIDFSMNVLQADATTTTHLFETTDDFYSPDCDHVAVPVPDDGALEGESGYTCSSDGDCHLLVVQRDALMLYEMWRADIRGDSYQGGCLAVWDMSRVYGPEGRGERCTSADAAGYPIAPLLFSADEVASGEIRHAIRFILPNETIRESVFVAPATHGTSATSGGPETPPYGAHLRLRSDYPVDTLPTEGAKVVAKALQTYGMFLADGGNVALTAQSDAYTDAKWDGLLDSHSLTDIQPQDFELMPLGETVSREGDCVRAD